ncbi:Ca2+-transporting ATPase [Anaerosolibacter carboniphilus]|uniref:P-type Ca(2+) transporter n=1 Tax=Anaerosolibacter carboniphilus TaxID=1417629 RepID=A0A841L3D1_9FIRM|nr:HAD-IC family P-type ATPase [Anaerosolibacter carboniphilus]MBB6217652.1 Ca2+-transporting ATPase [Anaerosolibacter carboniphilus]
MRETNIQSLQNPQYTLNIPGRMRIKIDALQNNKFLCTHFMAYLGKIPGILLVSANCYTGKILIVYDIDKINIHDIQDEVQSLLGNKKRKEDGGKVLRPNFRFKKSLPLKDFQKNKSVLSDEYYHYNLNTMLPYVQQLKDHAPWHTLTVDDIQDQLHANLSEGLSKEVIEDRLKKYGMNVFQEKKHRSLLSMFFNQFDGFIIKLLLGASGISLLLGQVADAATILVIIGLEATLGVWQEFKAEKSLDALKQMASPSATVLREGKILEIPAIYLVPGDTIYLEAGNSVPADVRLLEGYSLEVDEASLTGESYPVSKFPSNSLDADLTLGDRNNMLYMGTSVVRGKGKAIVVSTGMNTEMGKIAAMLNEAEEERTPLQKDLDKLAKIISMACIGICGIITLGGILGGHPLLEMLNTGVSLAVGAIPEGLTTVLTISLAFGVQRMAKKNAIVKTLPAVETLSCTKVICTDKTGTLTKNEMTVKEIVTFDKQIHIDGEGYNRHGYLYLHGEILDASKHEDLNWMLTSAALCNNASIQEIVDGQYEIKGDPTEAALLIAIEKSGISLDDFSCYKREHETPFDSETKRMTAICSDADGDYYVFTKGAADRIIHQCSRIMVGNNVETLTQSHIDEMMKKNEHLASQGLRVLGLAYRPLKNKPELLDDPEIEAHMIFLGLVGMMDPPRPEVKDAIKKCHQAGIKVVMITGDHKSTAASIAESIELLTKDGIVLSGEELDVMTDEELANVIDQVQVFARTCPQQKLKIVKAFKKKGYIVAMTGDGVNDAPAVKEAHVGIAMGKSGTDVTREASSIILTDDNFSTIVKAIEEGRTINRNIKKFMKYVLSGNFAEVLSIFAAAVTGMPVPLIPSQILMINLVTEGIPALSLGVDPPEADIMLEAPRDASVSIFDNKLKRRIITRGIATGLTTLGVFGGTLFLTGNLAKARTMAFANIVSCQMLHAFECSSMSITRNKYLMPSIILSTGLMLASIYMPPLASLFAMVPLNLMDWGAILLSTTILSRIDDFFKDLLYVARLRNRPSFGVIA